MTESSLTNLEDAVSTFALMGQWPFLSLTKSADWRQNLKIVSEACIRNNLTMETSKKERKNEIYNNVFYGMYARALYNTPMCGTFAGM